MVLDRLTDLAIPTATLLAWLKMFNIEITFVKHASLPHLTPTS